MLVVRPSMRGNVVDPKIKDVLLTVTCPHLMQFVTAFDFGLSQDCMALIEMMH